MFHYHIMDQEERPFARRLAQWIDGHWLGSIRDLGAGSGVYVEELRNLGRTARGYDIADPQPRPDLVETRSLLDITDPADIVICLEVAEHIDQVHSDRVIESVARNTLPGGWIIWSAAQPGQGGVGHINCQPAQYWRELARNHGLRPRPDWEQRLHDDITAGYHMGWFARNRQIWQRPHK